MAKRVVLNSEFAHADESPGFALWRVTNRWQSAVRAGLKPLGLTHVQFVLLASLTWYQSEHSVTQEELARHAGVDRMMTSQVLRTLEAKKLVRRLAHPTDRRARSLAVTATGASLANKAIVIVETVDREFFGTLHHERREFTTLLNRLLPPETDSPMLEANQ